MSFSEFFRLPGSPALSFEFFPPKQESEVGIVQNLASKLAVYNPRFMTVTYGAGGGTRGLTRELSAYLSIHTKLPVAAHLTCRGHSVEELDQILDSLSASGIRYLVALRGDPEKGVEKFVAHPQGFNCARDLVQHISKSGRFSIAVAGYPEGHREALSVAEDIKYLKQKVDAGADLVLTQLFFDAEYYLRFRDLCVEAGISVPIVPGVLPVVGLKQILRISTMCGAKIPPALEASLASQHSEQDALKFGQDYTVKLIDRLRSADAPGLHLYTLNRPDVMLPLMQNLFSPAA